MSASGMFRRGGRNSAVDVVRQHGGLVNHAFDEEIVALFGVPAGHEDDDVDGPRDQSVTEVDCRRVLLQRRLPVRAHESAVEAPPRLQVLDRIGPSLDEADHDWLARACAPL